MTKSGEDIWEKPATEAKTVKKSRSSVKELCRIALGAVLICVCSMISIPAPVPFTLQTFAVCAVIGILGPGAGTMSVLVYVLLGAAGLPVFAGFTGGLGVLLGTTGGYILGFLFMGIPYYFLSKLMGNKKRTLCLTISLVLGEVLLYVFGTTWFILVYGMQYETVTLSQALAWCVTPFLIPDAVKLALAVLIARRVAPLIHD